MAKAQREKTEPAVGAGKAYRDKRAAEARATAANDNAEAARDLEPLKHHEGEKPTLASVRQLRPEPVTINDPIDKIRGRALQVAWRPRTMMTRGMITKRQFAAASDLATLFEAGHVAPIKVAKWGDRVEGGGAGSRAPVDAMLDAGKRYQRAMDRLCPVGRVLVRGVVIEGLTIDALVKDARCCVSWLPASEQNRAIALRALFASALEIVADALWI